MRSPSVLEQTATLGGLENSTASEAKASLFADHAFSFEDLVVGADQDINVEEILSAYSEVNSANGGTASHTSPSDPVDQTAIPYNDSGSGVESYVSSAEIMNAIDDGSITTDNGEYWL